MQCSKLFMSVLCSLGVGVLPGYGVWHKMSSRSKYMQRLSVSLHRTAHSSKLNSVQSAILHEA